MRFVPFSAEQLRGAVSAIADHTHRRALTAQQPDDWRATLHTSKEHVRLYMTTIFVFSLHFKGLLVEYFHFFV